MKFIKVLGALMILLIGSSGFSFDPTFTNAGYPDQEHITPSELAEGSDFSYDSNLSAPVSLQKVHFFTNHCNSFRFCSSHWERKAKDYICYSFFIDPGLGVSDIIFPFHSFL